MSGRRSFGPDAALLALLILVMTAVAQGQQQKSLSITHHGFSGPQARGRPLVIEAIITAAGGVAKAQVFCRSAGGGDFMVVPMKRVEGDLYRAVVPDWLLAGSGLEYYIEVTDRNGRTASQGFRGFPLQVQLVSTRGSSREERLKALQEALDLIRGQNRPSSPGGHSNRNR